MKLLRSKVNPTVTSILTTKAAERGPPSGRTSPRDGVGNNNNEQYTEVWNECGTHEGHTIWVITSSSVSPIGQTIYFGGGGRLKAPEDGAAGSGKASVGAPEDMRPPGFGDFFVMLTLASV